MKEIVVGSEIGRGEGSPPAATPPSALLERMKDYGQEDVFAYWDELSPEERDLLVKDIQSLYLARMDRIIRCSLGSQGLPLPTIEPVPEASVPTVEGRTPEDRERWWKRGLKAISEVKLAVVLLSGGQGDRIFTLMVFVMSGFWPRAHDLGVQILRVVSVCLHMFTLDFLNQVANELEKNSVYHLAEKKIPSIHDYTMGLKLEQFIFDAFAYSPSTALFEALWEEFAPVKNANGESYDTLDSAWLMLLRLHSRWVVAAGGFLTHSVPLYLTGVEISPLCSYGGETLKLYAAVEHFVNQVKLRYSWSDCLEISLTWPPGCLAAIYP